MTLERVALPLARLLLPVLLILVVPLTLHLPAPALDRPSELIAWSIAVAAGSRILYLALASVPKLMDLSFWIFVYVFFGAAAILQISHSQYPILGGWTYSEGQIEATQLRIVAGIAFYALGRYIWRVSVTRGRSASWWNRLALAERRCQLLGIIGMSGAVLIIILKTGLAPFFTSRNTLGLALFNTRGQVQGYQIWALASKGVGGLQQIVLTIPAFVVLIYLLGTRAWRRHKLLFASAIVISVITNNPISNARAWTGVVVIGVLAASVDLSKRSRHVYFAVGLLMTLVFSFGALGLLRYPAQQRARAAPSVESQVLTSLDYAMFQQELNGTRYVSQNGFTDGRQLAGSTLVYVPRSLWPSKPGDTGQLIAKSVNSNVSASLWTEFYIDFGYPMLAVGFILLGMLFAYLDNALRRSSSKAARLIIPVAAAFAMLLLRGSLQPSVAYGVPIFAALFFCVSTRASRVRATTASA